MSLQAAIMKMLMLHRVENVVKLNREVIVNQELSLEYELLDSNLLTLCQESDCRMQMMHIKVVIEQVSHQQQSYFINHTDYCPL